MRKALVWICSALLAAIVYALSEVAGLSPVVRLVLTFAGALTGSFLGTLLIRRLYASAMTRDQQTPPDPGNAGRAG